MSTRLAARLSVAIAVSVLMVPTLSARAQDRPPSVQSEKRVTLNLENSDLRMALKLLFQSAEKSFTVSPSVKGTVTLSLTDVPFRTALIRLLDATDQPLTYTIESGVYKITTDTQKAQDLQVDADKSRGKVVKLMVNYANAAELVRRFNNEMKALVPTGLFLAAGPDNSMVVRYTDEDRLRELKEVVRLYDTAPKEIEVKAELVIAFGGLGAGKPLGLISAMGRTLTERPITLTLRDYGSDGALTGITLSSGVNSVKVIPRVQGDGSVNLDAEWELDMTWKPAGGGAPVHVQRTFSGAIRSGGSANKLTGSTVKVTDERGRTREGQLLLYITGRMVAPAPVLPAGERAGIVSPGAAHTVLLEVSNRTGARLQPAIYAALAHELAASYRFEVLPEETALKAAEKLALRAPYDDVARDRWAREVGANYVICAQIDPATTGSGYVLTVRTVEGPGMTRSASATIKAAGDEGSVRGAAYAVVQKLLSYQPLEGKVLLTSDGLALVDRGAADGMAVGAELGAFRDNRSLGSLRVVKVFPHDCLAKVVDGKRAVQAEDSIETYVAGRSGTSASVRP